MQALLDADCTGSTSYDTFVAVAHEWRNAVKPTTQAQPFSNQPENIAPLSTAQPAHVSQSSAAGSRRPSGHGSPRGSPEHSAHAHMHAMSRMSWSQVLEDLEANSACASPHQGHTHSQQPRQPWQQEPSQHGAADESAAVADAAAWQPAALLPGQAPPSLDARAGLYAVQALLVRNFVS